MQAASARDHQRAVSGFRQGSIFPFTWVRFTFVTAFDPVMQNQGASAQELLALLLLALPSVLTRQKLLLLLELTERHHALAAVRRESRPASRRVFKDTPIKMTYFRFLSLSRIFRSRVSSRSISSPRLCAMRSSLSMASLGGTVFPLGAVKHPCGFWYITR